mmetsp:Transcript_3381/g.8039  ORF Transcript_3381/g.8039 Transcript_3381/m.8039 type:complete len:326 (-) Transcript_3381:851-1828(-)
MEAREKLTTKRLRAHPTFHRGAKPPKIDKEATVSHTISITKRRERPMDRHIRKHGELFIPKSDRERNIPSTKTVGKVCKRRMGRPVQKHGRSLREIEANEAKVAARKADKIQKETAASCAGSVEVSNKRESHIDRLRREHGFLLKKAPKSDKETRTTPTKREAKTTAAKNCIDIVDDDDDFSITDLDNPDAVSPWKPKTHKFRWKVGDTVEVAPHGEITEETLTDFCTIVGTNNDGTYNLQDIISKRYKKSVRQSRILGNYEDLVNAKEEEEEEEEEGEESLFSLDSSSWWSFLSRKLSNFRLSSSFVRFPVTWTSPIFWSAENP